MRISIALGETLGCGWYRAILPGKELERRGHQVTFSHFYNDDMVLNADVVLVQRQSMPASLANIKVLRQHGVPVLHEFDDDIHSIPTSNPSSGSWGTGKPETLTFEAISRICSGMIVSTPQLVEAYKKFNPNISVCYNAIDDTWLAKMRPQEITGELNREGQIRIGYAGSNTHRADLMTIMKPLVKIMREFPQVRIVFIGDNLMTALPHDLWGRVEFAGATANPEQRKYEDPYSETLASHDYYRLIQKSDFDIGIAPLESTTFNSGKSYLKVMQNGMLGIPTIASSHTPYRQYQSEANEKVCILAREDREWYTGLKALVTSAALRKQLAESNLRYVEQSHVISKKVVQWEAALERAAAMRAVA